MKKMNAILTAASLAAAALTPLASSASEAEKTSDAMTVSKTYESTYELTIPDTNAGAYSISNGTSFDVTAKGFLQIGEKMVVSVESENSWYIVDETYDKNEIKYQVSVDGKAIENKKEDIFEVAYNDEGQTKTVAMKIDQIDNPVYAGTYTDTLTFSVKAVYEES